MTIAMPSPARNVDGRKLVVLALQSPLLGNRTYGELLRGAFGPDSRVEYHAIWTPSADVAGHALGPLVCKRGPLRWANERNLDLFAIRFGLGYAHLCRGILERAIDEVRPDVLHLHTQMVGLLALDFVRAIPTVISTDITVDQTAALSVGPLWRWTYAAPRALEAAVLQAAAAVVPFSDWTAGAMTARYHLDPARVHVIPPGMDLRNFPGRAAPRPPGRNKRVLFVGQAFGVKGGDLLVDAFAEAFAGADVELDVMTGDEPVPSDPHVAVHRGVRPFSERWRSLYASADLFVLPTRREPYGLAFLEAMAAGMPVIGTRVGAVPEMVVDGETGFIVDVDDRRALIERMRRLVDDDELRLRMGHAARRRVERMFEARRNAARLEDLFVEVAHACA